jgi:hypothetical protein
MNKYTIFLISIVINLLFLYGYVKIVKPYVDEASKGMAQVMCPKCEIK